VHTSALIHALTALYAEISIWCLHFCHYCQNAMHCCKPGCLPMQLFRGASARPRGFATVMAFLSVSMSCCCCCCADPIPCASQG
jgi:hypothetical protein